MTTMAPGIADTPASMTHPAASDVAASVKPRATILFMPAPPAAALGYENERSTATTSRIERTP